jgi:hypothetical protein
MNEAPVPQRPWIVSLLVILTFVGTAYYYLFLVFEMMGFEFAKQDVATPALYLGILCVSQAVKAFGAWKIWNLEKMGFYLYASLEFVTAILSILVAKIHIDDAAMRNVSSYGSFDPTMSIYVTLGVSLLVSVFFISAFASYLSRMK